MMLSNRRNNLLFKAPGVQTLTLDLANTPRSGKFLAKSPLCPNQKRCRLTLSPSY